MITKQMIEEGFRASRRFAESAYNRFEMGAMFGASIERKNTLEEVKVLAESYGCFMNACFVSKINEMLLSAKKDLS